MLQAERSELASLVREIHGRGWAPGTGGNFSRLISREPFRLLITPSGLDKGQVREDQLLIVDEQGAVVEGALSPSAETLLHIAIIGSTDAGAVLHTHSVWNTLASVHGNRNWILEGYEMLKGLRGIETHEQSEVVPVLDNSQDMAPLAEEIQTCLESDPAPHGVLLRGHGLYTWGRDTQEARRHLEVLEFLFEVSVRSKSLER